MACDCNLYPGYAACGCKSTTKINKQKKSFCTNSQLDCQPNSKTFYTDCGGFNVGCKVYDYVGGKYNIVPDGFYSDGIYGYYVINGVVQSGPSETCPRFFRLDYIKDCLNKNNLSGTWYATIVDDNTWVPNTNVLYRIPIPLDQSTDCIAAYRSYWAVRFLNTTPVYNIGSANYIEAKLNDVNIEYYLPAFLQDRCGTKEIPTPSTLKLTFKMGRQNVGKSLPGAQIYISTNNGSTYKALTNEIKSGDCVAWQDLTFNKGTQIGFRVEIYPGGQQIAFNAQNGSTCPANQANYCEYLLTLTDDIHEVGLTIYSVTAAGDFLYCPLPPPPPTP